MPTTLIRKVTVVPEAMSKETQAMVSTATRLTIAGEVYKPTSGKSGYLLPNHITT